MFNIALYIICGIVVILSWLKDKQKTKLALLKAWKSFENILPQFLGVLVLIGIMLAYLDTQTISKILGDQSGWWGIIIAAMIGAVTLIPGFVAFPTAALLLKNGAGLMQMGAFVSTLMMVGIVTMPVEIKYFGRKLTIYRNLLAFLFSFLVAWVIGVVAK
ncbi:MAG TPA: permease [Firmicutes bacterium]|nr:permease [Bacillota bacterium]